MHEDTGHHVTSPKGYEVSDVQVKWVLWFGVGLVILTFFGYVVGTIATKFFRAQPAIGDFRATPVALEQGSQEWDLPVRLQVEPPRALNEFNATQTSVATGFGIVSDEPEIYRIPVETAMKIVAERGLPVFPKVTAPVEGAPGQ